ncbi:hypothetical protein [Colidextribacter sp. OB.20]|uniref:ribbon-helix-helix domain-containing protein n=1 Tax=Colidextribacter sp. OB.20 TaxID=2304568 RepID=UPI00136E534F|nr:hypothetical protein [Colidextribacter sp. OB.20]
MKAETKRVTVTLPPTIYEELERLAAKNGHKVPGYVRWLIWRHLDGQDISLPLFPPGEE